MSNVFKYLPGGIIMALTAFLYGKISSNKKETKSIIKTILASIIVTLTYTFIYIYITGTLKSMLNFLVIALYIGYVFNIKITKAIFMSFMHSVLIIIADILTMIIPLYIFKIDKDYLYSVLAGSLISNVIVSVIFLMIILILKKPLRKLFNYKISSNKQMALFAILTISCIFAFFAASTISASVASRFPYAIFSLTVPSNRKIF